MPFKMVHNAHGKLNPETVNVGSPTSDEFHTTQPKHVTTLYTKNSTEVLKSDCVTTPTSLDMMFLVVFRCCLKFRVLLSLILWYLGHSSFAIFTLPMFGQLSLFVSRLFT